MLNNEILHSQLISRRTFLIGSGKIALLGCLVSRMFYLQLIKEDKYKTLSDKNRINLALLSPLRGKVYDREHILIASNQLCFRLLLDKNLNKKYMEEINLLRQILALSEQAYLAILKKVEKASFRTPALILDQLNWQQISIIEEYKLKLSSLFIDQGYIRIYPLNDATSHLIGYMGQVNAEERRELSVKSSLANEFSVGKAGIEKYYEKNLRGNFGYKQMEINANGKYVRELSELKSIDGDNLYLNIDGKLQEKIMPYLSNKQGCCAIVIDCHTGGVLILASVPGFSPNNFVRLSADYWQELINNKYKPLINKALQSNYPPGSVFKIVTILAALEAGIPPHKVVNCSGGAVLGGNSFRCHNKRGHGLLNMFGALKHSCNSYMYEIARLIGSDKIINMAKRFGFGMATGIDLPGEATGFVPSKKWKADTLKSKWSIGDSFNLSIGQGFMLATPLQLARFVTTIASGGKLYTPKILQGASIFKQVEVRLEYLQLVAEAMYHTVNTPGGTAYYSRITQLGWELAGKTGTSQVKAKANVDDDLSRETIDWESRNHAIFVGFGPYPNARYSITVFVEHGGGGGRAAAPIASKIMLEVLNKYASTK